MAPSPGVRSALAAARVPLRGLTTRGRCLVAAGLAAAGCALVLDERDLLRVAALLVALPILSALLLGGTRIGLLASRSVTPSPLTAGAPASVTLTLASTGRLPVAGLLLSDGVPAVLGEEPRYAVGALAPGTTATVTYQLQPRVRGRHVVGPVHVRIADPLGLVEVGRRLEGTTAVLVRPALVDLDTGPDGHPEAAESGGVPGGAGATQQNVQDALVRPYRTGDDLRSVHWRSSARRDELMVRPQEQSRRTGTVVLLDVRAHAHHGAGPHSTLERAVSLAASAAAHLGGREQPVRLVTSDGDDLGSGGTALDLLALLQPGHHRSLLAGVALAGGDELVAVLGTVDAAAATELVGARHHGAGTRAVVLGQGSTGLDVLQSAGWAVVVAAERTPLPQVWRQLSAARPTAVAR